MKVFRTFPPNPHLYTVHVDCQLTPEMKERFHTDNKGDAPGWVCDLLALDGIQEVDLLRHYVRIRKHKNAEWSVWEGPIDASLRDAWGTWDEVEPEDSPDRLAFPLPPCFVREGRVAYEGVKIAEEHELARRLFAVSGIVVVLIADDALWIRRGAVFSWTDLRPAIEAILGEFSTTAGNVVID